MFKTHYYMKENQLDSSDISIKKLSYDLNIKQIKEIKYLAVT